MSNRRGNRRGTIGFILFAILLIIFAGFGVYTAINVASNRSEPGPIVVRTRLVSSSVRDADGKEHSLEARFAFEIDPATGSGITQNELEDAMQATMNRLSYEDLSGYDGLEYVKGEMRRSLAASAGINEDAVAAIYVTDFAADFNLPTDTPPPSTGNRGGNTFNRLFGSWQ